MLLILVIDWLGHGKLRSNGVGGYLMESYSGVGTQHKYLESMEWCMQKRWCASIGDGGAHKSQLRTSYANSPWQRRSQVFGFVQICSGFIYSI